MTRSNEEGAAFTLPGEGLSIALVYPNTYRVGMANLGYQFLYNYLNTSAGLSCERFFIEWAKPDKWRSTELVSEETGTPLSRFPLIAFSIPFESDYPNVPKALLASSIPVFQNNREKYDPIVVAGGISVSMNPEPLADFLDAVFIGEVLGNPGPTEDGPEFFSVLARLILESGLDNRTDLLEGVKDLQGVYIPSAYNIEYSGDNTISKVTPKTGYPEHIKAAKRRSHQDTPPVSVLFSKDVEFGDTLLIETNRGCSRGCNFCAAGWIHFPVRYRKRSSFEAAMDLAIEKGRTVGLVGSDLAGHPELEDILSRIIEKGGKFSLSSIRPEGLSPTVIELLAKTGQKTATLAPEVASPRLKALIGKEIPGSGFLQLIKDLVSAGIPNVRLYFMMGIPTETDEDFQTLIHFVNDCKSEFLEASRPMGHIGALSVQINPFIPKPWTPFQWAPMADPNDLNRRAKMARKALQKEPNIKLRIESPREAALQALLSRGDRRLAQAMLRTLEGATWSQALKAEGLSRDFYIYRERTFNEMLPWDITHHGVNKKILWRNWEEGRGKSKTGRTLF